MLEWLKRPLLRLLRVPAEPSNPLGGEGTLLVFRAAPGFFLYRLIGWLWKQLLTLAGATLALITLGSATREAGTGLGRMLLMLEMFAVALVLVQVPFSFLVLRLDYEMRWYKVTDRSLRIREGILQVREMTMTFANVQNIEITQGPIQRLFGIADLRVSTAGGGAAPQQGARQQHSFGMHVGYFRGVANAAEIRDLVVERLRRYRSTGLGDLDEAADQGAPSDADAAAPAPSLEAVLAELQEEAAGLRAAAQRLASG